VVGTGNRGQILSTISSKGFAEMSDVLKGVTHFDVEDLLKGVINVEFCKTGRLWSSVSSRKEPY